VANKAFGSVPLHVQHHPPILGVQLLRSYAHRNLSGDRQLRLRTRGLRGQLLRYLVKGVAQVRSDMSDSSLIVINAPSSFDSLVYRKHLLRSWPCPIWTT